MACSKFDHITCKDLIQSGSPKLYQLTPEKKNIGTLKRMTLGKKDPNVLNKTILLVGETGSGKSTLINALVNYAMGVEWEDNVWFKIEEEEKKSQSESQTSDVIVYEIFGFEGKTLPYSLTIIDTPGYGSTGGIEHDVIVCQRLLDLFSSEDGVHEINVVGLVLKEGDVRLSDRLSYVFNSVVSLFGKNMEKNIVALITRSNGRTPKGALEALKEANIKCAENKKNQPVHFLFDNCQHEDRTVDIEFLEHANKVTMKGMKGFTDFLGKTEPQKLGTTVQVLDERVRLAACIQNLKERVELIALKQTEIQQVQEGLKKHEEKMKNNADFTVEIDEVYKEKEPIDGRMWWLVFYGGAVCCTTCEENCHFPCTMAWYPKHCKVMRRGRCTSCSRKCPVSDHVKENWQYVTKTRKVWKTKQELKVKYDQAEASCEETTSFLEGLQKKLKKLQEDKDQWLETSYELVLKLEQISLNANALSTLVHLDFLIEKMNQKGDTEKVQKLEEMKSGMDEGTRSGMRYAFGKLTAAGSAVKGAVIGQLYKK